MTRGAPRPRFLRTRGASAPLVGMGGVEPPRPFGHTDLNRARLPFRHIPVACYYLRQIRLSQSHREHTSPSAPGNFSMAATGVIRGSEVPAALRRDAEAVAG